jgi:hypothetical protein
MNMNVRNRFGIAIATIAIGVVGTFGLAACGVGGSTAATTASTALSPEATALRALGFTDNDVTADDDTTASPDPSASDAPNATDGNGRKHPLLRRLAIRRGLAKNIQHGDITVSTKSGDMTIEVQRGVITAISSTSLTVKCADGFTETWTIGSPIHVIEHRTTVQPSNLVAGDTVGVAGIKNGSTDIAKLIVIPNAKTTTGS